MQYHTCFHFCFSSDDSQMTCAAFLKSIVS